MNLHFVGIGGIGISALAQFCVNRGDTVTGSEQQETSILPLLYTLKIPVSIPQKAENVPENCDLLIYSEAVPESNPERMEAVKRGIVQKSYFEFLGTVSQHFRTIAVAGTHGKTTTCGLIASGMLPAKFDATFFVGSTLHEFKESNFHQGKNDWIVVEACEYRENFRFLRPEIVVLTSVEWDHPDSFPTEDSYFEAFERFLSSAKLVIAHADDAGAERVLRNFTGEKIMLSHAQTSDKKSFTLSVPGDHNRRNAALALALAEKMQLPAKPFLKGISQFTGAARRQEFLGEKNGVFVYDDYGHHPTEIKVTLEALRSAYPQAKIGLVFEPHQFSRTRYFFDDFSEVLKKADVLGLFPIYEARDTLEDRQSVSLDSLIKQLPQARKIESLGDSLVFLRGLSVGDVLVFMGAGKISDFARKFMKES